MPVLTWLLVHSPDTLDLVQAERALQTELALRATCAETGQPSPHQAPFHELTIILLTIAGLLHLTRHLIFP